MFIQRYKLKYLLPLLVMFVAVLFNLISYVSNRSLVLAETRQDFLRDLHHDLTQIQGVIETGLRLGNDDGIRNAVSSFGEGVDIESMLVVDGYGKVIASTHIAQVGKSLQEIDEPLHDDVISRLRVSRSMNVVESPSSNLFSGYASICHADRGATIRLDLCGFVYIRANANWRLEKDEFILKRQAIYMGLSTVVITVLLLMLFHLLVTRRTKRMLQGLEAFKQDRNSRIGLTADDELGLLGRGIDSVLDQVVDDETVLTTNQEWLRSLFEAVPDGIFMIDEAGQIVDVNVAAEKMVALDRQGLIGIRLVQLFATECACETFLAWLREYVRRSMEGIVSFEMVRSSGEPFPVEIAVREVHSSTERRFIVVAHDISRRRMVEEKLQLAQKVFENASEAIIVTNAVRQIIDVNPAYERIMGYAREEVIGKNPNITGSNRHDSEFYMRMWSSLNSTGEWAGEIWDRRKTGEVFPSWLTINAINNHQGEVSHYVGIFTDISQQKATEEKLQQLAYYDPLTGLPNRALFYDRLQQELFAARRAGQHFALMFLDLDRFKNVNDTLGHAVGDELLILVAGRLKQCLRDTDTVVRLGGDEFTIILTNLKEENFLGQVAQKIIRSISQKYVIKGHEIFIGTSIGIAVYPNDGDEVESLIRNADTAMYQAKEAGRGVYRFFMSQMNELNVRRMIIERSLRLALDKDEFEVYYQPKIDLSSSHVVGVEALVRWHHEGQVVSPAEFIPLAEETGLIVPIGASVLKQACRQVSAWSKAGIELPVAVNLSSKQFQLKDGLIRMIENILLNYGVAAELIEAEITESMIMSDLEESVGLMYRLGGMGIKMAIDDFGTGYSSLSYLKKFPIDALKIDRSFIRDLEYDSDDAAIILSIISMAKNLNLRVIAEGVETESQLNFLREAGCDMAQGYLFSKPLPAKEFQQWLRDWNVKLAQSKHGLVQKKII